LNLYRIKARSRAFCAISLNGCCGVGKAFAVKQAIVSDIVLLESGGEALEVVGTPGGLDEAVGQRIARAILCIRIFNSLVITNKNTDFEKTYRAQSTISAV